MACPASAVMQWFTDTLIYSSSPTSKSQMACTTPLSPPPLPPLLLRVHFPSTSRADGAPLFYQLLLFAVTYESVSMPACVYADCLLMACLTGQNAARVVSGYLDSRTVTGRRTGWLLWTDWQTHWVAGSSRHVWSTDTCRTVAVPQLMPDIIMKE